MRRPTGRVPLWFDEAASAPRQKLGEPQNTVDVLAHEALNHGVIAARKEGVRDHATFLEQGDPATAI